MGALQASGKELVLLLSVDTSPVVDVFALDHLEERVIEAFF